MTPESLGSNYDVIVAGAGNAALTAALSAHQSGAEVLVLEKAPRVERGGNSRFSGGLFRFAYDSIEDIEPIMPHLSPDERDRVDVGTYSTDRFYADIMGVTQGRADPKLSRTLVEQSHPIMLWMAEQGVIWDWTHLWSVEDKGKRQFNPGSVLEAKNKGIGLMECLFAALERAGIEVAYQAKMYDFLLSQSGELKGLMVKTSGGRQDLQAGAVVLGAGGFEANPELRARYLGGSWDLVKVRGTRFNTGEVLQRAVRIGAKPAGHWRGCHATPIDADAPDVGDLRLTDKTNRLSYMYGIMVNREARRFVDEGQDLGPYTYAKVGGIILDQPGSLAYQIFDSKTVHLLEARYSTGKPVVADTIEGLACDLGLEPRALQGTVEEYNSAVQPGGFNPALKDGKRTEGIDPPKSNWALPIESPPFTAYPVTGGITFTFGGLKIDTEARVMDMEDNPIPGLYATGEITGEFFYHNYPGGTGLMRGSVFGRIAGRNAAAFAVGR